MNKNNRFNLTENDINYQKAFNTDAGQRVIEDLKINLGHGQTLFSQSSTNENLHFLLGRQSVINDILFILGKEQKRD